MGNDPIGAGGFADVWEGMYDGIKVCIKCPRVTKQTRRSVEKVSIRSRHIPSMSAKGGQRYIGILQGSNYVEEVETSECSSFRWCHEKPLAIYIRVDAKRDPNGVRQ